ncbi:hypothetical protein [Paraburkholderia sp. Ac-20340]|uniref:hypothetical protein n=1 Tax=Paraburkholderia sp. Ac-20340 TaxID=2703888 RepID=UPI001F121CD7|nr:hypothetical protein [Paraburkholderia sp. Ac-20340]
MGITEITFKRALRASALSMAALACALAAGEASAHTDVSVMLGVPAPVYAAPPPVVYQEAPVTYVAPAYGYAYGYRDEGDDDRRWHDHGHHRGWYKHHHDDDDEQ